MINKIINQIDNDFDRELKKSKENLKAVEKGKIKARVFLSKYGEPICAIPYRQEKVYYYIEEYTEISLKDFKKIQSYTKKINKIKKEQNDLIRSLIK